MRNLLISVVLLGGVGYLGTILYERSMLHVDDGDDQQVEGEGAVVQRVFSYPMRVEIGSADGREMAVTLLGRSATHIQFTREDGQGFVYPIDSLNSDSKALVGRYPNNGIEDATTHMENGSLGLGDLHVQELEKRIRSIDNEVEALALKSQSSNGNTMRRTIQREVEKLQEEKVGLLREISERQ